MTDTTASRKSFREIQQDAAMQTVREISELYSNMREMVLSNTRGRRLGEIVTVQNDLSGAAGGSYVVEVIEDRDRASTFTTVHGSDRRPCDNMYFHTVDVALLHLIARRAGDADDHGSAALFAGRALGVVDAPK
jgi:hypothetical protein